MGDQKIPEIVAKKICPVRGSKKIPNYEFQVENLGKHKLTIQDNFYLTMVVTRIGQAPMPASTRLRAYFWPATRHSQAPSTTPAASFGSPSSRLLTAVSSVFLERDVPRAPNACSGDRRLLWSGVELGLHVTGNCRAVQLSFSIIVKHYPMK